MPFTRHRHMLPKHIGEGIQGIRLSAWRMLIV